MQRISVAMAENAVEATQSTQHFYTPLECYIRNERIKFADIRGSLEIKDAFVLNLAVIIASDSRDGKMPETVDTKKLLETVKELNETLTVYEEDSTFDLWLDLED